MVNRNLVKIAERQGNGELTRYGPVVNPEEDIDLSKYVILEGRIHGLTGVGFHEYPDTLVAMDLISLEEADYGLKNSIAGNRCLEWSLKEDASKDNENESGILNPHGYLGYLRWGDAHTLLHELDAFMLTPRQFVDFLRLLRSGDVYDGYGNKIGSEKVKKTLKDVVYGDKFEWLDGLFRRRENGIIGIDFAHEITKEGGIYGKYDGNPKYSELIDGILMKEGCIGIWKWVEGATHQGLPSESLNRVGNVRYYPPHSPIEAVQFGVDSYLGNYTEPFLDCNANPQNKRSKNGVRVARRRE